MSDTPQDLPPQSPGQFEPPAPYQTPMVQSPPESLPNTPAPGAVSHTRKPKRSLRFWLTVLVVLGSITLFRELPIVDINLYILGTDYIQWAVDPGHKDAKAILANKTSRVLIENSGFLDYSSTSEPAEVTFRAHVEQYSTSGLDWLPLFKRVTINYVLPYTVEGVPLPDPPASFHGQLHGGLTYTVIGFCTRRKLHDVARSKIIQNMETQVDRLTAQAPISR